MSDVTEVGFPRTVGRYSMVHGVVSAARAIHIICWSDGPNDPATEILAGHARLPAFPVRATFGLTGGKAFRKRQNVTFTWVYQQAKTKRVRAVDADEFLHLDGQSFDDSLLEILAKVSLIRIVTVENVQAPAEGPWFRVPSNRRQVRKIYDDGPSYLLFRDDLRGINKGNP